MHTNISTPEAFMCVKTEGAPARYMLHWTTPPAPPTLFSDSKRAQLSCMQNPLQQLLSRQLLASVQQRLAATDTGSNLTNATKTTASCAAPSRMKQYDFTA
jgi:hypothetical protein